MRTLILAGLLAAAALPAAAQPAALIEGVQMPAWLERDGKRVPIVPGMELRAGDRIATGEGSRVLLKLAEGSVVKLGENGNLQLAEIDAAKGVFRAALRVLEGAFRFTTGLVAKPRRREVSVRVGQVTAGIRGTDFWGRSRAETEIVCLIEGALEVGAAGEPPVTMDKPLQFYRREKGRTLPVGFVDAAQLARWSAETDIEAGKGALRRGGRFSVQLAASHKPEEARALRARLREAGYPAELARRKDADQLVHTVRIRHLPSRAEAEALAGRLRGRFGVTDPVVNSGSGS